MASNEPITAVGVFHDRIHAEHAVTELQASGFQPEQIGFLIPGEDEKIEPHPNQEPGSRAEAGAEVGAVVGGTLGGLVGAALATCIIPGVGPVIAGGLLVGAVEAALAGVAEGGILGALIGMRIPEEKARQCHAEFHSGRTLVTVQAEGRYDEAVAILQRAAEWEEKRRKHPGERFTSLDNSDLSPRDGAGSVFVPRP